MKDLMNTASYHFDLPQELIAQTPAIPRDSCRLLCVDKNTTGNYQDKVFTDILDILKAGDVLWMSRSSMERCITSTQGRDTIPGEERGCTGLYGNTTTEQSHLDTKSTTRTGILRTMTFQILSAFRSPGTSTSIVRTSLHGESPRSRESTSQESKRRLRNGIGVKPDGNGIGNTQSERRRQKPSVSASVAGSTSNPHTLLQNSAPMFASQNGDGTTTLMMKEGCVSSAEKNSPQTTTQKRCVAEKVVLQGIEISEGEERLVYDLQVADCHEYFAEGVLVHNCLDALRYATWTRFGRDAGYGQYSISFSRKRYGHN